MKDKNKFVHSMEQSDKGQKEVHEPQPKVLKDHCDES